MPGMNISGDTGILCQFICLIFRSALNRFWPTMLLMRLLPNRLILQKLLSLWKETSFFIFGMCLQEFMPRQTIPDEVGLFAFCNVWCLMVDRIVPPEDGIVDHTHVASTTRKHVVLARNVENTS